MDQIFPTIQIDDISFFSFLFLNDYCISFFSVLFSSFDTTGKWSFSLICHKINDIVTKNSVTFSHFCNNLNRNFSFNYILQL